MKARGQLQTITAQLWQQFDQAQRAFQLTNEPEALHELRVTVRALRTITALIFRPHAKLDQQLGRALKQIAKRSNRARDLEICIAFLPDHPIVPVLQTQLAREYSQLRAFLRQHPFPLQKAQAKCEHRLASRMHWRQKIIHTQRQLEHNFEQAFAPLQHSPVFERELAAWHRLRIRVKRLRYFHEYLLDLSPLSKQLKQFQQTLGQLHDAQIISQYQAQDLQPLLHQARQELRSLIQQVPFLQPAPKD